MQWVRLILVFAGLVGCTVFWWDRQFLEIAGTGPFVLADGVDSRLVFEKSPSDPPVATVVELPYEEPVRAILMSFVHTSNNLVVGDESWKSGRVLVDWLGEDGDQLSTDTVLGLKGTGEKPKKSVTVIRCREGKAIPAIRFEHLGRSGSMIIDDMRVLAVDMPSHVLPVTVILLVSWSAWLFFFVRSLTPAKPWRCVVAALGLLTLGWFLIVPGPWAHPRPFGDRFFVGEPAGKETRIQILPKGKKEASALKPFGELPIQGSWLIQVRIVLRFLRPVLHVLLFAVPAVGLAYLCGLRCAVISMCLVTVLVEISQAFFWFGSDWIDLVDLLLDWAGITGSLLAYVFLMKRTNTGRVFSLLKRMAFPLAKPT